MDTGRDAREWAGVVAALAASVRDGWCAGATALWVAGRRREAAWLRADHRAAAAIVLGAASGRARDVAVAVRRCHAASRRSAAHPMLAAPWRDAARLLAAAAGIDAPRATGWAVEAHGACGTGREVVVVGRVRPTRTTATRSDVTRPDATRTGATAPSAV